jgi:hypothetical protein
MKRRQSASDQTRRRCDASAAAIVAGDSAQKYGESTRKERALINAFIPRSLPGEERCLVSVFRLFESPCQRLGSLAREARQGRHHFLGALEQPLGVIDMMT